MPYSEIELEEISKDPVRLKGYFWRVAMNARRMALQNRATSRKMTTQTRMNNYALAYVEGKDLLHEANTLDRLSAAVLDNIDLLVASSLEKQSCK